MVKTAPSAPRICIHVALARDAGAIARFERRLPPAARRNAGRATTSAAVGSTVSLIARDRDSGIVVGHAVAVPAADGGANIAVRVAEAYEDHNIGPRLVEQLLREAGERGAGADRPA